MFNIKTCEFNKYKTLSISHDFFIFFLISHIIERSIHFLLISTRELKQINKDMIEEALVTQRVRVRSPIGIGFLGEVFFRGFSSSPVRQMSGNFRPQRSPNIIWPSSSSYHLRLVGMTECVLGVYCLSCLCCLGGGPGIGLITHPGKPSMSMCGQKSMYVIHSLIPSPDRL